MEDTEVALGEALDAAQVAAVGYARYRDMRAFWRTLDIPALGAAFKQRVLAPVTERPAAAAAATGSAGGAPPTPAAAAVVPAAVEVDAAMCRVGDDGSAPAVVTRGTFDELVTRLQQQLEAVQVRLCRRWCACA